jgi:cyclic pyranopterin phosphate synthase
MELSHLSAQGAAAMVDVSGKKVEKRTAVARGMIRLQPATMEALRKGLMKKGDVLACARLAGILAGKRTAELIPLCHVLPIDAITVEFGLLPDGVVITATAAATARTGVEMEALTAVSVAALTIYDMCKAADTTMRIDEIRLVEKKKEEVRS